MSEFKVLTAEELGIMEPDDIAKYQDDYEAHKNGTEIEKEEEEVEVGEPKEEPINTTDEEKVEEDKVDEEPEKDKEEEKKPPSNDPYAFLHKKSKEDLMDIVRNGTDKIHAQGNELGELRAKIREIEANQSTGSTKKQLEDEVSEQFEDYDKNDIATIRRLARKEYDNIREEERVKEQNKILANQESARNQNMEIWANIRESDPEIADALDAEMTTMAKRDPDNTIYKKGWVFDSYKKQLKSSGNNNLSKNNRDATLNRKTKATTVTSGGTTTKAQTLKKPVSKMSAEEYLAYSHSKGIMI